MEQNGLATCWSSIYIFKYYLVLLNFHDGHCDGLANSHFHLAHSPLKKQLGNWPQLKGRAWLIPHGWLQNRRGLPSLLENSQCERFICHWEARFSTMWIRKQAGPNAMGDYLNTKLMLWLTGLRDEKTWDLNVSWTPESLSWKTVLTLISDVWTNMFSY